MRVLIVKTSSMGDIIHTLPALTDASKQIYDINFDWVVEESFAEIPKWHPYVKRIVPVAIRRWRKNWLQAIKQQEIANFLNELRLERYDCIIDAQGLIKSALISLAARGSGHGFDFKSAREPLAACFYKTRYLIERNQHAITRTRKLFACALGYPVPDDGSLDYSIDLGFPKKYDLVDAEVPYLVFVHGTSKANKCWSEENWLALAKLAMDNGFVIKLPWGNQMEFERAQSLAARCNGFIVLPQLTLTAVGDILANAHGVITVDTGLGHLAAALGVPTVALYGPTDCKLAGTWGLKQQNLSNFTALSVAEVWGVLQGLFATIDV